MRDVLHLRLAALFRVSSKEKKVCLVRLPRRGRLRAAGAHRSLCQRGRVWLGRLLHFFSKETGHRLSSMKVKHRVSLVPSNY